MNDMRRKVVGVFLLICAFIGGLMAGSYFTGKSVDNLLIQSNIGRGALSVHILQSLDRGDSGFAMYIIGNEVDEGLIPLFAYEIDSGDTSKVGSRLAQIEDPRFISFLKEAYTYRQSHPRRTLLERASVPSGGDSTFYRHANNIDRTWEAIGDIWGL